MGSKIAQKSDLGLPEASREQFWGLLGGILEPFGGNFGTVWWLFSNHFTTPPSSLYPAASFCRRSRYLVGLSLLLPWRPRYSGSAGARVSAYSYGNLALDGVLRFRCSGDVSQRGGHLVPPDVSHRGEIKGSQEASGNLALDGVLRFRCSGDVSQRGGHLGPPDVCHRGET